MDRIVHGAGKTVRNVYFLLLVFVIIAMIAVVISIKSTQKVDARLLENQKQILNSATTNQMILQTLLDCTPPTGKCAKRNQADSAEAVGGINAITMAAVACADAPGSTTLTDLRDCVQGILEADAKEEKP